LASDRVVRPKRSAPSPASASRASEPLTTANPHLVAHTKAFHRQIAFQRSAAGEKPSVQNYTVAPYDLMYHPEAAPPTDYQKLQSQIYSMGVVINNLANTVKQMRDTIAVLTAIGLLVHGEQGDPPSPLDIVLPKA